MHERKHRMFERSGAFVALPGGIGTVEEIVEIMTWAQLHRDHLLRPIIVDRAEDVIPAIVGAAAKDSASEDGVSSIIDKM
jgi:hypothetical protein